MWQELKLNAVLQAFSSPQSSVIVTSDQLIDSATFAMGLENKLWTDLTFSKSTLPLSFLMK